MGLESMNPYAAAAKAAAGIISGVTGIFQTARANKLAKKNVRPDYNVPDAIKSNQQIAEQQATQGLPAQQYLKAQQDIGRNANSAMTAAQDRRSGLGAIGAIQQGTNDATLNLNVADGNARMSNIRNLMAQNNVLAQYQDKAWDWNSRSKYEENRAAIAALKAAGNANINTGLNSMLSMGAEIGQGGGAGGGGGFDIGAMDSAMPSTSTSSQLENFRNFRSRGF